MDSPREMALQPEPLQALSQQAQSNQTHPSQRSQNSGQRCENCRSRKLFTQDGRLWCRRCGTMQEAFIQTQQDDEFAPLKSSQITRQKKDVQEKVKKTLTGTKALYLYLSCYQLILQHLCKVLIDKKGLSPKLEPLVKDLWELRMKLVRERYIATRPADDEEGSDATLYSSQGETDYTRTDDEDVTDAEGRLTQVRQERDYPSIVDMLALIYMACMLMRIPVSVGSMFRWLLRDEVLFSKPLRFVPAEMQHRLGPRWLSLLQIRAQIQPSKLYSAIHNLVSLYSRQFSINLPPLNYSPLLHHYVVKLSLPVDLCEAVTHLSSILPRSFAFPKPRKRITMYSLPEIQLVAFLVVGVKLFYSMQTRETRAISPLESQTSQFDLGDLQMDWSKWIQSQRDVELKINGIGNPELRSFYPGTQLNIKADDVFEFDSEKVDSYMDWFADTWIDPVPRQTSHNHEHAGDDDREVPVIGGVMGEILGMFPTAGFPNQQSSDCARDSEAEIRGLREEAIKHIQSSITPNTCMETGKDYIHYRHASELGDSNSPAKVFHQLVADIAGLGITDLLKAVYKTERRLLKWWVKEKRRRQAEEAAQEEQLSSD